MHNVVMQHTAVDLPAVMNHPAGDRFRPNASTGMPVSPGRIAAGVADATIEHSQAVSFGRKL